MTDEQAQTVVDAVLSTLWERRPFKWDLGKMKYGTVEGEESEVWKEMMETMRDDLRAALEKLK